MTNTEAIKILDGIEEVHGVLPEDGNEVEEALNMAIKALQEQADRNEFYNWDSPIRKQAEEEKNCDNCGKLKYHCQECGVNLDNWTPKQTDKIKAQADGDLISKHAVKEAVHTLYQGLKLTRTEDDVQRCINELPTVAIPPEHDGCKDCVYQDNPQDAMPCRECKQNYMDKWKAIPSAEPYKGMTKGEVIMAVKGEAKVIDNKGYKLITFTDDWWNSPYNPQESEDKE